MKRNHLILGILATLGFVPSILATVEYARREKKACIYCHFSDHGGPKNFLGHHYAKHGYSFQNTIYGEPNYDKQAPMAPDLSFQRPTAQDRIIQRQVEILKSIHYRVFSGPTYYAAGQMLQSGKEFANQLDKAGIAYNKNLEEILVREIFGMGRYNVEAIALQSNAGLSLEFGPLVHLKARNADKAPAEYLKERLEFFKKASGYTGEEHMKSIYAEYRSGDPHYVEKPNFETGEGQQWDQEKMNKTIEMETLGMGIYAKSVLAANYLKFVNSNGVGVTPRAGYKAQQLIYQIVNTMLWIRYGLGFDGAKFQSFSTDYYDTRQILYIPNTLVVEYDGKSGAPASYYVKERLSYLRDLSALLLGISEFFGMSDPHNLSLQKVFGGGPDDSEEFPFSYNSRHLARELVYIVLKNIELMHYDKLLGAAYSTATLVKPIKTVKARDLGLLMHSLGKAFKYFYDDPEIRNVCGNLIYSIAQFVIQNMQATDGGVGAAYDVKRLTGDFLNRTLEDQSGMIQGMLEAFKVTREEKFYHCASRIYDFMIRHMWDEEMNTFRTHEESKILQISPANFGSTMGALREMVIATGDLRTFAYMLAYYEGIMKNYSLQLSELDFTGEKIDAEKDSDADGIPQADLGDGKFGIAPVLASEVQIEPIH